MISSLLQFSASSVLGMMIQTRVHDWTIAISRWSFGVTEDEVIWSGFLPCHVTSVLLGPIEFRTQMSAPTVAAAAGAGAVVLFGLISYVGILLRARHANSP